MASLHTTVSVPADLTELLDAVMPLVRMQASKLGVTPQELYAQFPLTVTSRAAGQQQSQVLDQYASSVTPEAKPGALTVQGVHFSTARRATLDGRYFGTG